MTDVGDIGGSILHVSLSTSAAAPEERAIAELAARQHGVVAASQLRELGFSRWAIEHRLETGRLHRIHRGVYSAGHPHLGIRGRWMAAALSYEPGFLSHRDAAVLWDIRRSARRLIDVTTSRGQRRCSGIDLHRVRTLDPADCTAIDGIPVTTLARTLLDLSEVVIPTHLRRAIEEAERLQKLDLRAVDACIERNPGRHGIKPLRAALAERYEPQHTRSEIERVLLELCRSAGLPLPVMNAWVCGHEVDASWPGQRLVVELDGYGFHSHRAAFERDRRRDTALQLAGYRVLRITYRRITSEPAAVVAILRQALQPRARGGVESAA
jgi:very-short-patch-repair endonuclease